MADTLEERFNRAKREAQQKKAQAPPPSATPPASGEPAQPSGEPSGAPPAGSLEDRFNKAKTFFSSPGPPGVPLPPATLPAELPEKALAAGARALPYIGATLAPLLGPEAALPAIALAFGGGATGSLVESGVEKAGGLPGAPQSFGETAERAGVAGAESAATEAGGRIVTGAISKALGKYFNPEQLYQGGLKPKGTSQEKAERSVATGIREKIKLNEFAPEKVQARIDALNKQVEDMINSSPTNIPPTRYVANIESKLAELRTQWGKDPIEGQKFIDQIDDFERDFLISHANVQPIQRTLTNPVTGKKTIVTITPDKMTRRQLLRRAQPIASRSAQDIKKAAYRTMRAKAPTAYDPGAHPGLTAETRKAIARALKEELEQIYPRIKSLNSRQGDLIDLEDQLDTYVKREWNKQITPYFIFPAVGAMFGQAFGHAGVGAEGGAAAGVGAIGAHFLRQALEDPAIKSQLAITLDTARNLPGAGVVARITRETPQIAARALEYQGGGAAGTVRQEIEKRTPQARPAARKPSAAPLGAPRATRPRAAAGPPRPAPPAAPPDAARVAPRMTPQIQQQLDSTAQRVGVPMALMRAVAKNEGLDPRGVSPKGAQGLMQLMPATQKTYGVTDPMDPQQSMDGGARYLRHLMTKYRGDMRKVLAAYNAGEGPVDKYNGVPPYPETQKYVQQGLAQMGY